MWNGNYIRYKKTTWAKKIDRLNSFPLFLKKKDDYFYFF
jgi:hypothetical protein